ncbi:hypothetical protein J6R97_05510 [bacterium]|nr:hypothetical protein [bacterium]
MLYKVKETKNYRKTNILFGLISIKTKYTDLSSIVRVLGLEILTFKILNGKLQIQFNIKIPLPFIDKDKTNAKLLVKWAKKNYSKDFDSIFTFYGSPSGETYIILNILNSLLAKNGSQKPLLVVDKPFKYELCKMFQPNIPVVLCKDLPFLYFKNTTIHKLKDCTVYSFFPTAHYLKQDVLINAEGEHYYSYITKALDLSREQDFITIESSNSVKEKVAKFISDNKLDKFVIISPEANTCSEDCVNWEKICNGLKDEGFDVVLNVQNMKNYIPNTIPVFLPYEEMLELTKFASAFLGLRSGLVEILSQNTRYTPFYVLYSAFPERGLLKAMDSEKALSGFSLKKLPNVNAENVFECEVDKIEEKDILDEIFNKLFSKVR